jgi:hypothetical protein
MYLVVSTIPIFDSRTSAWLITEQKLPLRFLFHSNREKQKIKREKSGEKVHTLQKKSF